MSENHKPQSEEAEQQGLLRLTIIGAGTIGLSFVALHILKSRRQLHISIFDTRPDLQSYVEANLPTFFGGQKEYEAAVNTPSHTHQISYHASLKDAVASAEIVQEQGPENLPFKQKLWPEVESFAPENALFWSSTSGIPASEQSKSMKEPGRLIVVHPFNPPHIMPLLEVVSTPETNQISVAKTVKYWKGLGREPVVIKKEVKGFVANRLAFALLKEAISLVQDGVVDAGDLDTIVEASMGPRWAVVGPFKSYAMGGGPGGLEGFMKNIGGTVQNCWDDAKDVRIGENMDIVYASTRKAYGDLKPEDLADRDEKTRKLLDITSKRLDSK